MLLSSLTLGLTACATPQPQAQSDDPELNGVDYSWDDDPTTSAALSLPKFDAAGGALGAVKWTAASNGMGPVEQDKSNGGPARGDGKALTINGAVSATGLGVHADSSLTFSLRGQCQTFTARVGIDDEVGDKGSAAFHVYGDGQLLAESGVLTGKNAGQPLSATVAGVQELRLVVTDGGDGIRYDRADWADAALRGCAPETLTTAPSELVFSGVSGAVSAPQTVTVSNEDKGDLSVTALSLGGANKDAFQLENAPAVPFTLGAGERAAVRVRFAPGAGVVGVQGATLQAQGAGVTAQSVRLSGLSARGEQGGAEPPLQQVVDALGYKVNVGGAQLVLGTGSDPIGDEVIAPLFEKAQSGPVTLRAVARYSPDDEVPFGYYLPGAAPDLHPLGAIAKGQEQTLNPALAAGADDTLSFDPVGAFGLYAGATSYAPRNTFTQDGLNTGATKHAARIYPLKNRDGQPIANSYLIGFEPAENGDYQDYVFVVSNVKPSAATALNWAQKTSSPIATYEAQGAAVNGKLYVFGGFDRDDKGRPLANAEAHAYDPAANTWKRLADMPKALTHSPTAVDGNVIYLAGGFVGNHPGPQTDEVWKYNTATDKWSSGPRLPGKRGGGALVRLGRELHFFGGTEREGYVYKKDSGDHWVLNLDGGTNWTPAAAMPDPRNHMAGVVLGGKIYAVGGQHLGEEKTPSGNQSEVDCYDPATKQWAVVAAMPRPLGHVSDSTIEWDGRIVVLGGVTVNGAEVANVIAYDPGPNPCTSGAGTWTELTPLPAPRQSPIADVIGDRIVITTGEDGPPESTTWVGTR